MENENIFQRRLILQRHLKESEENVKSVKALIMGLDIEIFKKFIEDGMSSVKLDDGTNIHTRREVWAKLPSNPEEKEQLYKLLRDNDEGHLITESTNSRTMSSWVKSFPEDENGEPVIPDTYKDLLGFSVLNKIVCKIGQ